MPHDERLAERIRDVFRNRRGLSERKMFGGVAFLLRGNMICGVIGRDLMVRVGKDAYAEALGRRHVREMDFTGRPLAGLVTVTAPGLRTARQLEAWLERGLAYARGLPPKQNPTPRIQAARTLQRRAPERKAR